MKKDWRPQAANLIKKELNWQPLKRLVNQCLIGTVARRATRCLPHAISHGSHSGKFPLATRRGASPCLRVDLRFIGKACRTIATTATTGTVCQDRSRRPGAVCRDCRNVLVRRSVTARAGPRVTATVRSRQNRRSCRWRWEFHREAAASSSCARPRSSRVASGSRIVSTSCQIIQNW